MGAVAKVATVAMGVAAISSGVGAFAAAGSMSSGAGLMAGLQIAGGAAMAVGTVTGNKKLTTLGGLAAGVGTLGASGAFGDGFATSAGKTGGSLAGASGSGGTSIPSITNPSGSVMNSVTTEGLLGAPTSGYSGMTDQLINSSIGNTVQPMTQAATNPGILDRVLSMSDGTKQLVGGVAQGIGNYVSAVDAAKIKGDMDKAIMDGKYAEAERLRTLYNDSLKAQPVSSAINPNAPNPYAVQPVNVMTTTANPTYQPGLIGSPRIA